MSYQAHRSHRGTYTRKVKVTGGRELTGIVCGRCGAHNHDPAIQKPCSRKLLDLPDEEPSSLPPNPPVDPEVTP